MFKAIKKGFGISFGVFAGLSTVVAMSLIIPANFDKFMNICKVENPDLYNHFKLFRFKQ